MSKKYQTPSGIALKPYYGPEEVSTHNPAPGTYPFTRGVHRDMYRGKLWTMRQYAGFGSAKEANERYKFLLSQGTTGLSVAFDLPTQMGRDSDHPLAKGEVGRVGVAISTVEDMQLLFEGIPLEQVSVSMTINSTAAVLLGLLLVVAERRGIGWDKLNGTIQNDLLKEYVARGTYIYPPKQALRIITDIFSFCSANVPLWNTINVSGYHIREAGSTAVEEVAFTLANGIAYVQAAIEAGLSVDSFAPRVGFFFNCHNNFLEEVAKFRAARRLWAEIMRDRFKAKNERSMMLRFHTQTAGSSLTAQQPMNNVVRTTIQAFAAVCGGTQSLHTNSFDEALSLPTEGSAQLALRTQQVIAQESGISTVADPLGGAYVVEALTDQVYAAARQEIEKIDAMGGMLAAIEARYPQSRIERSAYEYQQGVESGAVGIVGVNCYQSASQQVEEEIPLFKLAPQIEQEQSHRLRLFKRHRAQERVEQALARLRQGAGTTDNLMNLIVEALRVDATLGEVSDVLRDVFGEYRES